MYINTHTLIYCLKLHVYEPAYSIQDFVGDLKTHRAYFTLSFTLMVLYVLSSGIWYQHLDFAYFIFLELALKSNSIFVVT